MTRHPDSGDRHPAVSRLIPAPVKRILRRSALFARYSRAQWERDDPFHGTPAARSFDGTSGRIVGVIRDIAHNHRHYLAACRELDVGYRVIDIFADNWQDQVRESGLDLFFVWPSVHTLLWKTVFDERIRVLVEILGRQTVPALHETWIYESKRRARDWLMAHDVPHPETHVFLDRTEALDFVSSAELPLVFKADRGGGASGVVICRERRTCERLVAEVFGRGYLPTRWHPRDRHWGAVMFQAYVPDAEEWRIVRIGDTYLCRYKEKSGDFHSGSGSVRWAEPPPALLDMAEDLTERGAFRSMNIDFFRNSDGTYLVNELHALFGDILMKNRNPDDPWMGRWNRNHAGDQWEFTPGYYYRNACANLRIQHALGMS